MLRCVRCCDVRACARAAARVRVLGCAPWKCARVADSDEPTWVYVSADGVHVGRRQFEKDKKKRQREQVGELVRTVRFGVIAFWGISASGTLGG